MLTDNIKQIAVKKANAQFRADAEDVLAIEEPLEIRLNYGASGDRMQKNISVTMRTPGNDSELAVGFLFTEGIIKKYDEVKGVFAISENIVQVVLTENVTLDLSKLERNFYTTSSCGVCGKSSIDAIKTVCTVPTKEKKIEFSQQDIYQLPEKLRAHQEIFDITGGLHASALFDATGKLIITREDVGRHNALDKLIGACLIQNLVPLDEYLLLLSGRASFELIQKAAMAGIKVVTAVGAPSSLAVSTAAAFEITLIGFLRDQRFNIYTGAERIIY